MATPLLDLDLSALTASERLILAQQLVDSVLVEPASLSPAQLAEMQRRAKDIDSGRMTCEPWDIVCARLSNQAQ
jgi:putative addiction module component (TIGR02574 family)